MRFIITLVLFAFVNGTNAQSLLISMNFGDCVKCSLKLNHLRPDSTGIPTFIVMDENYFDEKQEIEEKYEFGKLGIQTIYSGELWKQLHADGSMIYLLGVDGSVLFKQKLFNLSLPEMETVKKLYSENYLFRRDRKYIYKIKGNTLYCYNDVLNYLTTIEKDDTIRYRMTPEYAEKGMEAVFSDYKKNKNEYRDLYESQPSLKPYFDMYYPDKEFVYNIAKFSYVEYKTKPGQSPYLWHRYAIYKFKKGALQSITPVEMPPVDTATFDGSFFVVKNDSTVFFEYYPSDNKDPDRYNPYIGQFNLKGKKLQFTRWLNLDLPDVYKKDVGFNYMSFRIVDYPYFILNLSQEISDLDQEKSHKFRLPDALDFSRLRQDGKRPLDNDYIFHDKQNKKIYVLGIVLGKWRLMGISTESWQLVDYIDLNSKISKITNQCRFLHINLETRQLYAVGTDDMVRSYPLALVLSK